MFPPRRTGESLCISGRLLCASDEWCRSRRPPWVGAVQEEVGAVQEEEENLFCADATTLVSSSSAAACAPTAATSAPAPQRSSRASIPEPSAVAAAPVAKDVKQQIARVFETEPPRARLGEKGAAEAVDWRQEWSSL